MRRSESQSEYADEGTAAHEVLEFCLRNSHDPYHVPMDFILVNGKEYPVDLDMKNAVAVAYDYIQGYLLMHGGTLHVEERVDPGAWMLRDDLFGTADACVTPDEPNSECLVADYKHGKGIAVDVEGNTQLMIYALGFALPYFSASHYRIAIIQPRAPHRDGPIREHVLTREELKVFYDELEAKAAATDDPNAVISPGAKQCRFCDYQPVCPELMQHNLELAMDEFTPLDELDMTEPPKLLQPATLSKEQTAYILENLDLFTKWAKAVSEHAREEAERGVRYPRHKLVRKRGTRYFVPEEDALIPILRGWGLKLSQIYTRKLNGPAPIEKLIKSMKDREITQAFNEIVDKKEGGLTLVSEDDPRKEVYVESTTNEFDDGLYEEE